MNEVYGFLIVMATIAILGGLMYIILKPRMDKLSEKADGVLHVLEEEDTYKVGIALCIPMEELPKRKRIVLDIIPESNERS